MKFRVWLESEYEFSKIKIYLPTFQSHHQIKEGDKVYTTENLARLAADKILKDKHLPAHVVMCVVNPKEVADSNEDNIKTYRSRTIVGDVVYKID